MISPDARCDFGGMMMMMQSAEDRQREMVRGVGPILLAAILGQRQMRPRAVVVLLVGTQNMTQMPLMARFCRLRPSGWDLRQGQPKKIASHTRIARPE